MLARAGNLLPVALCILASARKDLQTVTNWLSDHNLLRWAVGMKMVPLKAPSRAINVDALSTLVAEKAEFLGE